jgi:hypothetical protein
LSLFIAARASLALARAAANFSNISGVITFLGRGGASVLGGISLFITIYFNFSLFL